jgi:hypothetical protein
MHKVQDGVQRMATLREQAAQVGRGLRSAGGGLVDAKPRSEPAPEGGRDQQLTAPAEEAAPGCAFTRATEPLPDRGRVFAPDRVAAQSFDDHGCGVPAVRMQPIGHQAHRVAADEAQKAPHRDQNPEAFGDSSHLTRVVAVADELKDAPGIAGGLAAADAERRAKRIDGRGFGTSSAELLDGNGQAVYNNHRFEGAVASTGSWPKEGVSPLLPFLPDELPSYSSPHSMLKRDESVGLGRALNVARSGRNNEVGTVRFSRTGMLREILTFLHQSAA